MNHHSPGGAKRMNERTESKHKETQLSLITHTNLDKRRNKSLTFTQCTFSYLKFALYKLIRFELYTKRLFALQLDKAPMSN